jgi:hypothetical protein
MLVFLELQLALDRRIALIGQFEFLHLFEDILQRGKAVFEMLGGYLDVDEGGVGRESGLEDVVSVDDILERKGDGSESVGTEDNLEGPL